MVRLTRPQSIHAKLTWVSSPLLQQTDGLAAGDRKFANALDCARQIYRTSGVPGFFRGLIPTLIRVSLLRESASKVLFRKPC